MAVSIDDKFSANYNNGVPRVASVVANRVAEDGTLQCDGLAGWSTDTPVHFTTFTRSTDQFGNPSVTSQQWFKGVVNGDTITQLTKYDGLQDTGNLVGDVVEPMVTAGYLKDLVSAVLVSLAQDGSLKTTSVVGALNSTDGSDDQKITNPDLFGDDIVQAQYISSGTHDFNDYVTSGKYAFSSGATLENKPGTAVNGILQVMSSTEWPTVRQVFYRTGTVDKNDSEIFTRTRSTTDEWGKWSLVGVGDTETVDTWKKVTISRGLIKYYKKFTGSTGSRATYEAVSWGPVTLPEGLTMADFENVQATFAYSANAASWQGGIERNLSTGTHLNIGGYIMNGGAGALPSATYHVHLELTRVVSYK